MKTHRDDLDEIKEDEPVLLIRATDPLAMELCEYISRRMKQSCPPDIARKVYDQVSKMFVWRSDHKKDPKNGS